MSYFSTFLSSTILFIRVLQHPMSSRPFGFEALRAMARDFEMVPPPIPESLLKALRGELM